MTQPRIRRDWAKPRVQREKVEQAHGVQLLRSLGAAVYVSGTHRKKGDFQGTMQTPGIPDVEAWLPGQRVQGARRLLKWEVKAGEGRLNAEQRVYQALCVAAGVAHLCGDCNALIAWLIHEGYLRRDSVAHYRVPPRDLDAPPPKA